MLPRALTRISCRLNPTTLAAFLALLGTSGALGCNAQCDRDPDEPPVPFREGFTDKAHGVYASAGNQGPFLEFPPGRTYRFFHGLGAPPCNVHPELAFERNPVAAGEEPNRSGSTVGAGNQATKERVTATYFDYRNDTCSNIFLRVTADDPEPWCASGPGSLDAGPTTPDAATSIDASP
jgi:hypothetical protein